jgi:hypothetical protein
MTTGKAFGFMVLFAFAAFLSFVQIDSAHADANDLNGLYIGATAFFALLAVIFLTKVSKAGSSNDSGGK